MLAGAATILCSELNWQREHSTYLQAKQLFRCAHSLMSVCVRLRILPHDAHLRCYARDYF